jgi:hypothetical protein
MVRVRRLEWIRIRPLGDGDKGRRRGNKKEKKIRRKK